MVWWCCDWFGGDAALMLRAIIPRPQTFIVCAESGHIPRSFTLITYFNDMSRPRLLSRFLL
jgi:hypothetical protein